MTALDPPCRQIVDDGRDLWLERLHLGGGKHFVDKCTHPGLLRRVVVEQGRGFRVIPQDFVQLLLILSRGRTTRTGHAVRATKKCRCP